MGQRVSPTFCHLMDVLFSESTFSSGNPVSANDTNVKEVVNANFLLAITVTDPDEGLWEIILSDRQYYTMDVSGQSVVDFSYQFLETDDLGVTYPTAGSPVAGEIDRNAYYYTDIRSSVKLVSYN